MKTLNFTESKINNINNINNIDNINNINNIDNINNINNIDNINNINNIDNINNTDNTNNNTNKYNINYNEQTEMYIKMRLERIDPITYEKIDIEKSFKFQFMWDPLSGERINTLDPYGALYFNPINILKHIYYSKLNGLWIDSSDNFQGYYGDNLGAGNNIEIISRGIYPERYLFRLPITDCYVKKGQKLSVITMGPKLLDTEIREIDKLIQKYYIDSTTYNTMYKKIKSLENLKYYYEIAIADFPLKKRLDRLININNNDKKIINYYRDNKSEKDNYLFINKLAVDVIKNMNT